MADNNCCTGLVRLLDSISDYFPQSFKSIKDHIKKKSHAYPEGSGEYVQVFLWSEFKVFPLMKAFDD